MVPGGSFDPWRGCAAVQDKRTRKHGVLTKQHHMTNDIIKQELVRLARLDDHTAVCRLGRSVLAELIRRGKGTNGALLLPLNPGERIGASAPSTTSWTLAELELPAPGTLLEADLTHEVSAFCCASSAAQGRWQEAKEHAQAALKSVRRLVDATATSDALRWSEICHSHAALLAALRHAEALELGDATRGSRLASSQRQHGSELRMLLGDHCARLAASRVSLGALCASDRDELFERFASLLQVASGVVCSLHTLGMPSDAIRAASTAIRCAHGALCPSGLEPGLELGGRAAWEAAPLPASSVRVMVRQLLSLAYEQDAALLVAVSLSGERAAVDANGTPTDTPLAHRNETSKRPRLPGDADVGGSTPLQQNGTVCGALQA